ncbi:uncharacterized protein [Antedon mediterranea]|uniref:uncharacterized protein n=1 Tax=Antedon mediterranea TaxID=105859 RepID=UPI003AF84CA6
MGKHILLWFMILLVYLWHKHSLFVFGETETFITATPGQNVLLTCVNVGIVRWFTRQAYITTGRTVINTTLGLQTSYFAIPGTGHNYSLLIKIPDDINVWKHFNETYECRLTWSGNYDILNKFILKIYLSLPTNNMPSTTSTETETDLSSQGSTTSVSFIEKTTGSVSFKTKTAEHRDKNTTKTTLESTKSTGTTEPRDRNKQIHSTVSNPTNSNQSIHLIVIMSVSCVVILFLIIFIIYYVRRRSEYKQNPSFKSATPDDHEYVEVDLKVNPTTKGENQEMLENSKESVMEENQIYQSADMNGKQNVANKQKNGENQEILENSKESVMEENWIYESADMNGKQINDDGNVAKKQKKEIKNVIVDGEYTKRIYKTGEQVLEQSEAFKKSALENSNEDGTNDGIVYHEKEAYESLDDININNAKLDQKESDKKGTKIPAYVHYEVLELE